MSDLIFLLDLLVESNLDRFVPLTAWLWSVFVGLRFYRVFRRAVLDVPPVSDQEPVNNGARTPPSP